MRSTILILAVTLIGCGTASEKGTENVDWVFLNGQILTLDDADTRASAMAIRGEEIVAVGGAELRDQYQGKVVDLDGSTILPGFNDTHVHIIGRPYYYIDLTKVASIAEIQQLIAAKVAALGEGAWITGYGWSEDELAEGRRPLRGDLDAVAPNNPIMLTRAGAHSAVFSTTALALAGVDATTPDPEGGVIERDEDGELNGVIRERHNELVGRLIPDPEWVDLRASLAQQLKDLFSLGITSFTQANGQFEYFSEWQAIYEEYAGQLPRGTIQHFWRGTEAMEAFRRSAGVGDEELKVGAVKLLADGGFTGPAAYTKKPYRGEEEYRGKLNLPIGDIRTILTDAHAAGWQLGVHAIGDAAIELVVEILADALAAHPRADHRHYLNHFTVMPSLATMDKMAARGIAISQQPNFLYTLEGRYVANLDGDRLQRNNPMATPMSRGIHVAMSSDILPLGPWVGIYAATTRKGMSGAVYGPEEKISRIEALRAYTAKAAWLTFEEDRKGMLKAGMLADFIVLDEDPLSVPDEELLNLRPAETWLGGRQVYVR